MFLLVINLISIIPYLLDQFDICTWPSFEGQLEKTLQLVVSWLFQSCPKFLKFGNLCGWDLSYYQNLVLKQIYMNSITLKVEGATWAYFGIFSFFMEQWTCALFKKNSLKSSSELCTTINPGLKQNQPKLNIICERYWLLYLSNTWQHFPN